MTFLEAYHKFREIEDEHNLFNLRIQGFPVWDCLRMTMWYKFLEATETCAKAHHSTPLQGKLKRNKRRIEMLKQAVLKNPFFAGECEYLFLGHQRRKLVQDGTYWDIYSDPVIEQLGTERCLVLESPRMTEPRHATPAHTKRLRYSEGLDLFRRIYRLNPAPVELEQAEKNILQQIDEVLVSKGLNNQDLGISQILQSRNRNHQINCVLFNKLLKKLKPKAVFLVCSYGKESQIAVCRQNNIPTIELQHGVMTPYHPGYSYPQGTKKDLFPNYFFSFGKYWEDTVNLPLAKDRIFTVGYPYFDQQSRPYADTPKQNKALLISQGPVGDKLSRFAVDLSNRLPTDWELIYKLHPGEVPGWRERYGELASSDITVIENDSPPLYQLMGEAKIQVGVSSTAIFEGLGFDCRTYIVKLPGHEYMQPLIDQNICTLVNTPDEIDFQNINSSSPFKKDYFFADNWQENLDCAMAQIGLEHQ